MKITREQRDKIIRLFPKQQGNVKVDNHIFLNAIIYIRENGCKWRPLPSSFGPWHTMSDKTIYNYVFFRMKGELKKSALRDFRPHGKKGNQGKGERNGEKYRK
jgi:transposase